MSKNEEIDLIAAEFKTITDSAAENTEGRDGFYTVNEIAELIGLSKNAVLIRLRKLREADRLEVKDIRKVNIAGRANVVPGYKIKPTVQERKSSARKTKSTNKT